jgi:hypothetical protein
MDDASDSVGENPPGAEQWQASIGFRIGRGRRSSRSYLRTNPAHGVLMIAG